MDKNKLTQFISDVENEVNVSEKDRETIGGFFKFTMNKQENNYLNYALLVKYSDEEQKAFFLETLVDCFDKIDDLKKYTLKHAEEDVYIKRGGISKLKLGSEDILIVDLKESGDNSFIQEDFLKNPGVIKIACISQSDYSKRFLNEKQFLYSVFNRRISLQEVAPQNISARFLRELKKKYKTTKEYDDELYYYVDTIYDFADRKGDEFVKDLIERTEVKLSEDKGLSEYLNGKNKIDVDKIEKSDRVAARKEIEEQEKKKNTEIKEPEAKVEVEKIFPGTTDEGETEENVLLITMSTFNAKNLITNTYYFTEESGEKKYFYGISQLEPGTKRVLYKLEKEKKKINRIVIIETKETYEAIIPADQQNEEIKKRTAVMLYLNRIREYLDIDNKDDYIKNYFDNYLFKHEHVDADDFIIKTINDIKGDNGKEINLYIDTQGGLRDLNTQMNAVLELLKNQGVRIAGRYLSDFKNGQKENRIMEVDDRYRTYDFLTAMNSFERYGQGEDLVEYLKKDKALENDENAKLIVDSIKKASDAISLCRANAFDDAITELQRALTNRDNNNTLIDVVAQDIRNDYKSVWEAKDKAERYINQIKWCLGKGFIQAAITFCEAKIPYVLVKSGIIYYAVDDNGLEEFKKQIDDIKKNDEYLSQEYARYNFYDVDHLLVRSVLLRNDTADTVIKYSDGEIEVNKKANKKDNGKDKRKDDKKDNNVCINLYSGVTKKRKKYILEKYREICRFRNDTNHSGENTEKRYNEIVKKVECFLDEIWDIIIHQIKLDNSPVSFSEKYYYKRKENEFFEKEDYKKIVKPNINNEIDKTIIKDGSVEKQLEKEVIEEKPIEEKTKTQDEIDYLDITADIMNIQLEKVDDSFGDEVGVINLEELENAAKLIIAVYRKYQYHDDKQRFDLITEKIDDLGITRPDPKKIYTGKKNYKLLKILVNKYDKYFKRDENEEDSGKPYLICSY